MAASKSTSLHHHGRQSFIIIFDFDHTVLDCNTDEVIPRALGRSNLQETLLSSGMQLTAACDTIIAPFTAAELREAAANSVVIDPQMPEVFQFLRNLRKEQETLFDLHIASDSNMLFIESSLDARLPGVREMISQIHTNPYEEVDSEKEALLAAGKTLDVMRQSEAHRDATYNAGKPRRSRLSWYDPHDCQCCLEGRKPNMCKSRIIHRILQTTPCLDPTIIFIGDGRNDYCPVQHVLRPRDYVFARRDFPLHQELSHPQKGFGSCHVKLWSNARELLEHFQQVILQTPRLPTIVRFRDVHESEFRTVSLMKRIPNIFARLVEAQAHGGALGMGETTDGVKRSTASMQGMKALIQSLQENGSVPLLPGQTPLHVPQWLRNMTTLPEYDTTMDHVSHATSTMASQETKWGGKEATKEVAGTVHAVPRWGQLPWLHGEIYLYHLLWQWMMLHAESLPACNAVSKTESTKSEWLVNQITPYTIDNPLYSMSTAGARATFRAKNLAVDTIASNASADHRKEKIERFKTSFLVDFPSHRLKGIRLRGTPHPSQTESVTSPLPPSSGAAEEETGGTPLIPASAFAPYRDIFVADKKEVTMLFMQNRIVPMVVCQPWKIKGHGAPFQKGEEKKERDPVEEGEDTYAFLSTLLRWMLWGNGVDLSMFTMKELIKGRDEKNVGEATKHGKEGSSPSSTHAAADQAREAEQRLHERRRVEKRLMESMESFLVGNETAPLQSYIEQLVAGAAAPIASRSSSHPHPARTPVPAPAALATNHVDIVCDNVGVELVADLLFALWFITHSNGTASGSSRSVPTVTFHVKPMPYYISDVTARDIARQLEWMEEALAVDTGPTNGAEGKDHQEERDETTRSSSYTPEEVACVKEFISLVRDAFSRGQFTLESELVWTQPNEYREVSPEVFNQYFYTQQVAATGTMQQTEMEKKQEGASGQGKHCKGEETEKMARTGTQECSITETDHPTYLYREHKSCVQPKSALVIFKGDLNYRRLVGDRHWCDTDFTTSLLSKPGGNEKDSLNAQKKEKQDHSAPSSKGSPDYTMHWSGEEQKQRIESLLLDTLPHHQLDAPTFAEVVGAYWPTQCIPVCSIRTIKSECCVGVPGVIKKELDQKEGFGWRVTGKYGEILLAF